MKLLYLALLIPMLAFGDDDYCEGNPHYCGGGSPGEQGPPGVDGRDGTNGVDGVDGTDGVDGRDGTDGVDGLNGLDGINGINGINGRDGVVNQTWINKLHTFEGKYSHYMAASEALQIYLPQDQESRITFGMSSVNGSTGLGVGYAFVNDDGVALTIGVGTSSGEQLGRVSAGFEFGGERNRQRLTGAKYKAQLECSYVGGELTLTNECVVE